MGKFSLVAEQGESPARIALLSIHLQRWAKKFRHTNRPTLGEGAKKRGDTVSNGPFKGAEKRLGQIKNFRAFPSLKDYVTAKGRYKRFQYQRELGKRASQKTSSVVQCGTSEEAPRYPTPTKTPPTRSLSKNPTAHWELER